MSESSPLLDRAGIEDAFRRLGERLARRGVVADLYVLAGAAMALAYDFRQATSDVECVVRAARHCGLRRMPTALPPVVKSTMQK